MYSGKAGRKAYEKATGKGCKCSMSISMLGDGCRYCQPQGHIDRLSDHLEDAETELAQAQATIEAGARLINDIIDECGDDKYQRWLVIECEKVLDALNQSKESLCKSCSIDGCEHSWGGIVETCALYKSKAGE